MYRPDTTRRTGALGHSVNHLFQYLRRQKMKCQDGCHFSRQKLSSKMKISVVIQTHRSLITWHFNSGREKAEISPKLEIKSRQFSERLGFYK